MDPNLFVRGLRILPGFQLFLCRSFHQRRGAATYLTLRIAVLKYTTPTASVQFPPPLTRYRPGAANRRADIVAQMKVQDLKSMFQVTVARVVAQLVKAVNPTG
jgi:hypothetical protein